MAKACLSRGAIASEMTGSAAGERGGLCLAGPRGPQLLQLPARSPFGALVTLPFIGELQPGEFVGIDGALPDRPELTVGLGQ